MSLVETEQEALKMPERERPDLVCKLLDGLPSAGIDVSDEEVFEREQKLEAGRPRNYLTMNSSAECAKSGADEGHL